MIKSILSTYVARLAVVLNFMLSNSIFGICSLVDDKPCVKLSAVDWFGYYVSHYLIKFDCKEKDFFNNLKRLGYRFCFFQ